MTDEDKKRVLISSFQDEKFQYDLAAKRQQILKTLEDLVSKIHTRNEKYKPLFSVESRIKSYDSFEEKIHRKNYIQKWTFDNNIESAQKCIRDYLPDLIGFRINCYFQENEKIIYDWFKNKEYEHEELKFSFNENTTQNNGHIIYKFAGKYRGDVSFEVQIKSVMHNVWGEVEHKTVYKNRNYNSFIQSKRKTTEVFWDILQASDKQLVDLYNAEESDDQLLRALFFNNSKRNVQHSCCTDILANHYERYYKLFPDMESIKKYVISVLRNEKYVRENKEIPKSTRQIDKLVVLLQKEFPVFNLKCLYEIDSVLYEQETFCDFLKCVVVKYLSETEDDEFDKEVQEDFYPENSGKMDDTSEESINEDFILRIDALLGGCRIYD